MNILLGIASFLDPPPHTPQRRRDEMATSGSGFALAACSAAGSAVCEMSRKRLVGAGCDVATVVALVCLIEGVMGVLAFVVGTGAMPVPSGEFWLPALAAAAASALTTSMLAKAYSENDISSCAPFNAALPVFQLLVTSFVLRDEARLPAHRIAGVCVITGCAFWLAKVSLTLTSAFSHWPSFWPWP